MMKTKLMMMAMAVALAACGKGGGGNAAKLKEFEGYRDRMCHCTDADCANETYKDWQTWREGTKGIKFTDAEKQHSKEINSAFFDCLHNAGGGTP